MKNEITLQPSAVDHKAHKVADALRPLRGRRLNNLLRDARTIFHTTHTPGAVIEMSRGRRYRVAADGSYRKF